MEGVNALLEKTDDVSVHSLGLVKIVQYQA